MNIEVQEEIERQINSIIGTLSIAKYCTQTDSPEDAVFWIDSATTELIGLKKGIEIIYNNHPTENPL